MRTRQGLEPNFSLQEALYPAKAMLDMGAATARGVTRGTLGLPGDLESLVRLGIGGKQQLPTSEDWDKRLPPMSYLANETPKERSPFDSIGQFYNVPIYGGALAGAGKGIKHLGGKVVGGETNLGRREFTKKAGAIGLGSTALAKAFKYLDELEKATPVAKEVEGVSPLAKRAAMKTASKYKYNSLKDYNDALNSRTIDELSNSTHVGGGLTDEALENLYQTRKDVIKSRFAKADEEAYKQAKFNAKSWKGTSLENSQAPWEKARLEEFSPQAKAEMKLFKSRVNEGTLDHAFGGSWADYLNNLDDWLK